MVFKRSKARVGKRAGRGKIRGKRKGKFYGLKDKGLIMINRTPAKLHNAVAPHFYTRLETGCTATTVVAGAPGTNIFSVKSSPYEPFNSGAPISSMTSTSLVPATLAVNALFPVGYHNICSASAPYGHYKCYASKFHLTCSPQALADVVWLCVFPNNGQSAITDFQQAQSQPYAKVICCQANNSQKENTISMYMDHATVWGITKAQLKADTLPAYNADQRYTMFWNVIYQLSNNTQSAPIAWQIKEELYVEFAQPNLMADT